VERYSHHITLTPDVHSRLSELELTHARQYVPAADFDISYKLLIAGLHLHRYTALLHQHFSSSVLNSLPEWLRRMDDVGNDGLSMGKRPPVNGFEVDANAEALK